ncbi:endonuclease/exonuclease/phosphatase family protein [Gilvimarinus sp. SDUM040013]|uniref:Endonuclease/exonuclease/phosphatase family protein n=1 Tax=Gilvimarinus gilvus TaxID=3058038 RepID=A0ABU4RZP5_9GAMM|nr:endonuclease/exonuclease/phosphatase family protein [Gilvimarinus sp. SDUM040013]MDO3386093.1 endonuclease/exonuclease/phosphatase family protein [Gilvimarinus sp. SDUM040013]MDX6850366.1 endonuclease/exonuclease/phosphatase family protein [Gilvimarinus sp. SDUM040013]
MENLSVRIATFNVSMEARNYQSDSAQLNAAVLDQQLQSDSAQIANIAAIIQQVRPDILLLNEFDRTANPEQTIELFQQHYLNAGLNPIEFPYRYSAPVNTGELFPMDLNGDGNISRPADTYGFGFFPGHYGMLILSRYPIALDRVRTFAKFKWKDMPAALAPKINGKPFYSAAQWQEMRLSSKSHWDVPVLIGDREIHLLASHPTPPVFDGAEDRNGRRNHDEIRLWFDYISGQADYLYDDVGERGSLTEGQSFVIAGDLNASATEGDGHRVIMQQLLSHPKIQDPAPTSVGGEQARPDQQGSEYHTAAWGMRADYVLPSSDLSIVGSGVFWPALDDAQHELVKSRRASSDHRLVWVDISL